MRFAAAGVLCMCCAWAQPAAREPRDHAVYEDPRVRILGVPTPDHDKDYVSADDTGIHFSRAGTTRAERDREVTVELLQPQTGARNVCSEVLPGEYLHCHEPGPEWLGANLEIEFETDQTRIGILRIAPNATLAVPPADVPPLLIPLEGTEAEAVSRMNGAALESSSRHILKAVEVFSSPADHVSEVRNLGKTTARFLVVEFGGAGE